MVVAVMIGITGAFAFNTKHMPPGDAYTSPIPPTSGAGTGTLRFPPGTTLQSLSGWVKGVNFRCNAPEKLCYFELTESSTITTDPITHEIVVTNVVEVNEGEFDPFNPPA
jgi:hypothetical protein